MYKKLLAILLSVSLVASLFCGCAKTEVAKTDAQVEIKTEVQTEVQNETKNEKEHIDLSTVMEIAKFASMNPHELNYYDDFNSMILALKSGKVDTIFLLPEIVARYIENHVEDVVAVEPLNNHGTIGLCIGTLKENTEIFNLFSDAIDKLLNNGTIEKLQNEYLDKYLRTKEEPKSIEMSKNDGAKTIKIAITGDMPPIDFITSDGKPAGFNIALLSEISKIANVNFELVQLNSAARLTALKTNVVDAVFYCAQNTYDNKEHSYKNNEDIPENIIYTKPYYSSRVYEVDSIKKVNELEAQGIQVLPKSVEGKKEYYTGMLSYAASSEEEMNALMSLYGWSIGVKFYDDFNSMMLALKSGQIDYISLLPKSTAEYIKARNNDVDIYNSLASDKDRIKYNMATLESNKEVYNILNDALNEIIKDGTINNIKKKYIDEFLNNGEPEPLEMPHFDGAKTIKIAVTGDLPPFDFVSSDGRPAGYNVALLSEIANRAKVNIELVTMNEAAKITALSTKNIDAIFWLTNFKYADIRNIKYDCPKGVIMTDCYYEDDVSLLYLIGSKYEKFINTRK